MEIKDFSISFIIKSLVGFNNIPVVLKEENHYLYGQIFTTLLCLIIELVIVLLYISSYLLMKDMILVIIHIINFCIVLLSYLFFIRKPVKRKALVSNITIFIQFFSALTIVLLTGGIESSALIWFPFLPAIMVFMNGIKNAIIWLVLSLFLFLYLYLGQSLNLDTVIIGYSSTTDRFLDIVMMAFTALFIISGIDISRKRTFKKLEDIQSELKILATTDPLTGLFNRRCFEDRAEAEIKRSIRYNKSLTVIMADLDYFKQINDTFGHKAGDYVLKEISKIIRKSLRDIDLIGRYGGEEFIMLFPELDQTTSLIVAERLREEIENTVISVKEKTVKITISIGITELSGGDKYSLDTLTHRADEALYKSKENGRNIITIWNENI